MLSMWKVVIIKEGYEFMMFVFFEEREIGNEVSCSINNLG